MGMFEKLAAYKIQHKNTVVPQQYEKDPKLHNVDIIKKVTYVRVDLLKSIDFDWDGARWNK